MKIPEKILVYVYEDLLGDALLKLPFVATLRHLFPKAHIAWCAGGGHTFYKGIFRPLVAAYLDDVIEVPLGRDWRELFAASPLKGKSYDLIIDTQRDVVPTLALKKIAHDMFVSRTAGFLFSDFRPLKNMSWKGHLSERLLNLLSLYTQKNIQPAAYALPDLAPQKKAVASFFKKGKQYVGFAPGAGNVKKCWPKENFLNAAAAFKTQGCVPVFILGPAEKHLYHFFKEGSPGALFPLQEKPALLKDPLNTTALGFHLNACVVNDAGVGHLMGLSPTHLVSLFGPTLAEKVHPLSEKITLIKAQKFGSDRMEDIPVDAVLDALKAVEKSL